MEGCLPTSGWPEVGLNERRVGFLGLLCVANKEEERETGFNPVTCKLFEGITLGPSQVPIFDKKYPLTPKLTLNDHLAIN